jgi:hypothetical protein
MPDIFISYSHEDQDVARTLIQELGTQSVAGWMDATDIWSGDAVNDKILRALNDSSVVIVLISPDALQSEFVNLEVGAALALGKRILPILVKNLGKRIPPPFRHLALVDARKASPRNVARDIWKSMDSFKPKRAQIRMAPRPIRQPPKRGHHRRKR